jgi:hypothetical protein
MPVRVRSALLPVLLLLGACQTESVCHELAGVRPDTPPHALVVRARLEERIVRTDAGEASVQHRAVGTLRTFEFQDGAARQVHRVYDLRDEALGYVTDQGLAYRRTAHGGLELVANSQDLRRNVAAVLGTPLATIEIVPDPGP